MKSIKIVLTILALILMQQTTTAQKVFTTDYASQAEVKVFVVDYESQADLCVYRVDYGVTYPEIGRFRGDR